MATKRQHRKESELSRLRARLAEAEHTLKALRSGDVAALVANGLIGPKVFTLQALDPPYRQLMHQMNEGVAFIDANGLISFCNVRLGAMLGRIPSKLIGSPISGLVAATDQDVFQNLLTRGLEGAARREVQFECKNGSLIPVDISLKAIPGEQPPKVCMLATDLTERKSAEKVRLRQAGQYARILGTTPDGFLRTDPQGLLLDANPNYCRMSGYSKAELLQMRVVDLEACETPEEVLRHLQQIVHREFQRFETQHRRKDGTIFDVEVSGSYYPTTGEISTFVRDITERKRAEAALSESRDRLEIQVKERTSDLSAANEKLRSSEQRLAEIINSALHAVITVNEELRIEMFNPAAEKLFGCHAAEALGHPLDRFIPQRFRTAHSHHVLLFGRSGRVHKPMSERNEICGLKADGTEFPIEASISQTSAGEKKLFTVILRDISERKQAEETLRHSLERLERVLEVETVGVMFWDLNTGVMVDANDAFLKLMGYSRSDVNERKLTWQKLTPPDYMDVSRAEVQKFLATGRVGPYEKEYFRKDGTRKWLLFAGSSLGSNQCVEFCVDISDRKWAEQALRESEQEFRVLAQNLVSGVALFDAHGEVSIVNRSFLRMFDLDEHSNILNINSRDWSQWRVFDENGRQLDLDEHPVRKAVLTRTPVKDRLVAMQSPERTDLKWLLVSAEPILDGNGNLQRVVCTYHDITARKQVESELAARAAELARSNAELEQFAYVASHDLKEPLRAVSGCVQLLQSRYQGKLDVSADELITFSLDGTVRMGNLIDGLLTYSRVGTRGGKFEAVECEKVFQDALENLSAVVRESGALVTHDPLPAVRGDPSQLVSLIQNLVGNALKFRREEPPRIHVHAERNRKNWHFSVRDNGIGIDPQHFERIFAVFQRLHTRKEYPGTGIGLAVCKKIIERHGGRIWVESEPGKGTTFYFTLLDARA